MARGPRRERLQAVAALWFLLSWTAAGAVPDDPTGESEPRPSGLVEEAESRLAQIDVTVTGPPDVAASLRPEDFRVKINLRWLDEITVDRFCPAPGETAIAGRPPGPGVSYLFYFDQPHLTTAGRVRAMDVARQLVPQLVVDGNRAMVVSNARRLVVIEEFSDDPQRVLDAIERLDRDRTQWDSYAAEEESRVERVVDTLNHDENVTRATADARVFQREETARTDKNLRRLRMTLSRLSQIDTWKAMIYFADTLRQNPGEHYVSFFGHRLQRSAQLSDLTSGAFAAGVVFDQLINEAVAQGIRVYPVFAQGLVTPFDRDRVDPAAMARVKQISSSSHVRFRDAQNTLASMASETGGHVFLRGESPAKIAENILEDFSCLYTLSFSPEGFAEDSPLRIIVKLQRDDVKIENRGRMVIQSASARLTARLFDAFAVGDTNETDFGLHANLVPTGFDRGAYAALLQISVPGTRIPAASWEMGASVINRDKVLDEVSGRLAVRRPGLPLILEREITIKPGRHEIVAVAHEAATRSVLSERLEVSWPDPDRQPVTCGPLALLQPTTGAFVRAGRTRTRGSLARTEGPRR